MTPQSEHAHEAGEKVQQSRGYQYLVMLGLICFGLIHLMLGYLCVQVALGGGGNTSTSGALADLVAKPFGNVLMIVMGLGLFAMTLWQVIEAAVGYGWLDDKKRTMKRVASVGRAIAYAGLGFTALRLALGAKQQDQNQSAQTATGTLMQAPGGQVLVALAGAVVLAIGISQIVKGVRRKFIEDDLEGGVSEWAKKLGTVGWCVKGVSLSLVGLLIGWAAITYDPQQAAGLDGAIKKLGEQPFGVVLLVLMGLGFACFGVYCFVWSQNARHSKD